MRTILAQLKQYKKDSILTPLFTALEVIMEVMLPFITALIIDEGIQEGNMRKVYTYGGVMIVMAFISLISGAMAGKYAASASSGLACNLRKGVYDKVQDFSFSNIDKFSTAGLVTRMTTDVTNIQNAYQMCIRVAVRAPLMLVCSHGNVLQDQPPAKHDFPGRRAGIRLRTRLLPRQLFRNGLR